MGPPLEDEEWRARVELLESAVLRPGGPDDAAILTWLDRELPLCMTLVPGRRRDQFLRGLYRAWIGEEKGFGW